VRSTGHLTASVSSAPLRSFRRFPLARPVLRRLWIVLLALPCVAQAGTRPLAVEDLARLRTVSDVQVSPEGDWVAYTVAGLDAEEDRQQRDLWMVSWDGVRRIRLTWGPASASKPRWSPVDNQLAFLASRGEEKEIKKGPQVWLLDRAGGEAQRITSIPGGVSVMSWSPDGKKMVLEVEDPDPDEEPELKEGWKRKTRSPVVVDRYGFKKDSDGYLGARRSHLLLLDVASGKVEPLTTGRFSEEAPAWSPDGARIGFVSNRTPDPDRNDESAVFVVKARAGAEARQLTSHGGPDEGKPSWSPDGKWIAFLRGDETKYTAYNQNKLAVVPSTGGAARVLTEALDRRVYGPLVWSRDSTSLAFLVQDDRAKYVGRVALSGGPVEKLTSGRRIVDDLAARKDGDFALLAGTANDPLEVAALHGGVLRALSAHNEWLREVRLGTVEDFSSRSTDGTEVHGLLAKPPDFETGRKYPAILWIHGGPNMQDEHGFRFERHFLAARGFVVLAVNYRGGSGRGSAYQKAIFADWGNKEVQDLLGAADEAVRMGVVDPDRLGIGGWSYGGILTNYVIARDSRFKAAVSGASSSLQLAMYGTDEYVLQYESELGPPWKSADLWIRLSYPFFHADRIKTPTLFMGGTRDFNVPVAGAEQMYQALRTLGIETSLVIYPDQHHEIGPLSYQRDRLERYSAWFARFLKP
jgi:dipeptidyl aminopeptidase/acylaminoacyl peptidase